MRPALPALLLLALGMACAGPANSTRSPASPPAGTAPAPAPEARDKPLQQPTDASPYTVLEPVNGTITSVDLEQHELVLEAEGGPVTLGLDRNTLVYLPTGLSTVRALRTGAQVRAARNGDSVAYWVMIGTLPPSEGGQPQPTPGQGTGPGGGAAPPAEGTTSPDAGTAGPGGTPGGAGSAPSGGPGPGTSTPGGGTGGTMP
ncbi:MAG: hypothetical protein QM767_13770 [Anaeromyxobacter sp.]